MISRDQPADVEAEASILGAILLNPEVSDEVFDFVTSRDFSDERYRLIYEEMLKMWQQEKALDLIVLRDELKKDNLFDRVGGGQTLMELQDRVPSSANVGEYTRIVHGKRILRDVIRTTQEILSQSFSEAVDADDLLDDAEQRIFDISVNRDGSLGDSIGELLEPILERMGEGTGKSGLLTGFPGMDDLTNGLMGGQLIIVAGRPGVGKSTFALNLVERIAARDGIPCGVFSLEMDAGMIAENILVMHCGVNSDALRKGRLNKEQHTKLAMGIDRLKAVPIYIDDTPDPSVLSIRSRSRRWCRKHKLRLLVVDYLQLMQTGSMNSMERKIQNRENEIAFISRSLKLLAKDLNIPIIAISQLNREVDNRQDKKPRLSDLRESGAIEQDADIVILMSREDYYTPEIKNHVAEIDIAKNRTGPTGSFQLAYMREMFKFDLLSHRSESES